MRTQPIRVLIVDDHPVVRGGLTAFLGMLDGIEVVVEASDGEQAIREAVLNRPDVAIVDLKMPGLDGVSLTYRLTRALPNLAVLVLTMFEEESLIADALAAGARGYLLKGVGADELAHAVRMVASGQVVLDGTLAARILNPGPALEPVLPQLSVREREVLELIARGLANAAIAERLGVAKKTVGNHISAIFVKIGVATRAEAIVLAREQGLGR